jgi:hypothetical protein
MNGSGNRFSLIIFKHIFGSKSIADHQVIPEFYIPKITALKADTDRVQGMMFAANRSGRSMVGKKTLPW